jgi:hypothetical protein
MNRVNFRRNPKLGTVVVWTHIKKRGMLLASILTFCEGFVTIQRTIPLINWSLLTYPVVRVNPRSTIGLMNTGVVILFVSLYGFIALNMAYHRTVVAHLVMVHFGYEEREILDLFRDIFAQIQDFVFRYHEEYRVAEGNPFRDREWELGRGHSPHHGRGQDPLAVATQIYLNRDRNGLVHGLYAVQDQTGEVRTERSIRVVKSEVANQWYWFSQGSVLIGFCCGRYVIIVAYQGVTITMDDITTVVIDVVINATGTEVVTNATGAGSKNPPSSI